MRVKPFQEDANVLQNKPSLADQQLDQIEELLKRLDNEIESLKKSV